MLILRVRRIECAAVRALPVILVALLGASQPKPVRGQDAFNLGDLVFVTEDNPFREPGCDAISVFSLSQSEPVHRGTTQVSPGRLAANEQFSLIVALNSNTGLPGPFEPFLYLLRGNPADRTKWTSDVVVGDRFAVLAGLAVLPDGNGLLVPVVGARGYSLQTPLVPPYHLNKYRLDEISAGQIGPVHGSIELDGPPFSVLPTKDGEAHVVTEQGTVYTIDVTSMTESHPRIQLSPLVTEPVEPWNRLSKGHADITGDGRYLVANRWDTPELNVADLLTRQAWTIPVAGVEWTGGVAINKGWYNPGLLALHAGPAVVVYRFEPERGSAALTELGRHEFRPAFRTFECYFPACTTAVASVAWSAAGGHVIVAAQRELSEFLVIGVDAGGRKLTRGHWYTACPRVHPPTGSPNDILTANGFVTPPPTPPPTATATPRATATPTATSTRTAVPTATRKPQPRPLFLPLVLKEHCDPTLVRADIVLVLDTSSSMTGPKLADAKDAAISFARLLDLAPGRDQVAVVRFDTDAELVAELGGGRAVVERAIGALETRRGTHIDKGLRNALEELQSPRRIEDNTPVMVLLTDGRQTGREGAELIAAQEVRNDGIRLYTIGLGSDVDEAALVEMAGNRSRYHFAPDSGHLKQIYSEVARDIDCPPEDFWGQR